MPEGDEQGARRQRPGKQGGRAEECARAHLGVAQAQGAVHVLGRQVRPLGVAHELGRLLREGSGAVGTGAANPMVAWAIVRTWMISRSLYSMSGASAFVASSCGFTPRESATTATKEGGMGILSKEMATRLGTLGARWMSQWCLSGIVAAIQRAVGSLGSTLISLSTSSFVLFCKPFFCFLRSSLCVLGPSRGLSLRQSDSAAVAAVVPNWQWHAAPCPEPHAPCHAAAFCSYCSE